MKGSKKLGRPREFDKSVILSRIMDAFWEQGYHATSLALIEQVTGLKKQSLYAAFGDKHTMYLAALAHYDSMIVDDAAEALRGGGAPLARIREFLSAPIESAFGTGDTRGCFLCNASADRAALDPDTQRIVERSFGKLKAALKDALMDVIMDKSPSICGEQASLLLTVYSGLRLMARSGLDRTQLESARNMALASCEAASHGQNRRDVSGR